MRVGVKENCEVSRIRIVKEGGDLFDLYFLEDMLRFIVKDAVGKIRINAGGRLAPVSSGIGLPGIL